MESRITNYVKIIAYNRIFSDYWVNILHMGGIEALRDYIDAPISRHVILDLLHDFKSPNDKISELIKAGFLTPLKKGLYTPGPKSGFNKIEPFLIANHLWGPSYVSMESALSYWGLIPERVHEVSSITTRASKKYENAVGRFTYRSMNLPYYAFGIKNVSLREKQTVMIASPEKAICDKIVTTPGVFLRSTKQALEFLTEDMRMDEEVLRALNVSEMTTWLNHAPKKASLEVLVKTLRVL